MHQLRLFMGRMAYSGRKHYGLAKLELKRIRLIEKSWSRHKKSASDIENGRAKLGMDRCGPMGMVFFLKPSCVKIFSITIFTI